MSARRPVGIGIFYWMDRWSDDQAGYVHKAREAGYDGVEVSLPIEGDHPVERLRAELERHELGVVCSTGLTPSADVSSPDPAVRRAGIEHLKRAAAAAAALGSPLLGGVTYAPWLHFPPATDLRPYRERSAAALAEVATAAGDLGIEVCLEVLNRFETGIFNTVADGLRFLDMVDRPWVKLELDTFHMNIEEDDLGEAIRQAGRRLGHFQCAANNRRPPQFGHLDWAAIRTGLDDVGYGGWVVFETFPNPDAETGRTTYTWRHLVGDADGEARAAATFVREWLA